MSVFELVMLLCFGIAWPFFIHKSLTSHSVKGKSLAFFFFFWFGYLSGVLHKIFYHPDVVIVFYVINLTMVSVDAVLYLRNRRKIMNKKIEDEIVSINVNRST